VTVPTQNRANEHRSQDHGVSEDHVNQEQNDDQITECDVTEDDVTEDDISGDQVTEDDVSGDPVSGDPVSGDPVSGDPVSGDYVIEDYFGEEEFAEGEYWDRVTDDHAQARPMIDPRIRERRIEVLRAAGRRRLRVTLVVASAIVAAGLGYLAVRSPLLAVDHIRVMGSQREPISKIMSAAGVHNGQAMLFIDTGAAERRIERLQWVARARVRRDFPDTVHIDVTEYVPTAYVRMSGGKIALIASSGHVIALSRAVPRHAVAVIGEHVAPVVGSSLTPSGAADVVSQLPEHLRAGIFAIDVGGSTAVIDLRAAAPAGTVCRPAPGSVAGFEQLRLGTLDSLRDKGVAALAVLSHLAGRPFNYIDVSVPQAPVSC
jgi:cell division protein FtsQ